MTKSFVNVFEVHNMDMKQGDTLKIQGRIRDDADKFAVNLGSCVDHIALHFNPRFHDERDGAVIVCNSKRHGSWESDQRDSNFPFSHGAEVKIQITFTGENFEIKLPNGDVIVFPNRLALDKITYLSVDKIFKMISFKFS
uniref:galectin-2-like n=1 Tax=Pristiophorus japonicus TaxID=55135 RepID=UPI00398E9824